MWAPSGPVLARSRRSGRRRRGCGCFSTTGWGRSRGPLQGLRHVCLRRGTSYFWLALQLPACCRGWLSGFNLQDAPGLAPQESLCNLACFHGKLARGLGGWGVMQEAGGGASC